MTTAPSLARLFDEAVVLGLGDKELDELIYDTVHRAAARRYNHGALPDLDDLTAFDTLHNESDWQASQINNAGIAAQLEFLLAVHGERGTRVRLRDTATTPPSL